MPEPQQLPKTMSLLRTGLVCMGKPVTAPTVPPAPGTIGGKLKFGSSQAHLTAELWYVVENAVVGRVHKKQVGAVPTPGPGAAASGLSSLTDLLCFIGRREMRGKMDEQRAKY